METVLLRKIDLPKLVVEAINAKLAADQQAQQMRFVLIRSARKRTANASKLRASRTSRESSPWDCPSNCCAEGDRNHPALAESPNSKLIIVGARTACP